MLDLNQSSTFSLFGVSFHKLPQRFQFYLSNRSCFSRVCPCLHVFSFLLPQRFHALWLYCLFAQVHDACSFSSSFVVSFCLLMFVSCIRQLHVPCHSRCLSMFVPYMMKFLSYQIIIPNPPGPELEYTGVVYSEIPKILQNMFVVHNLYLMVQNCRHFCLNANHS